MEGANHGVRPVGADKAVAQIDGQTEQEEGPGQGEHGDHQKTAPQRADQRIASTA